MEAFHLLSRGGVQFNKNKFKNDVQLFNQSRTSHGAPPPPPSGSELPIELDFFKYAKPGAPKRKAGTAADTAERNKRARRRDEGDDNEGADESQDEDDDRHASTSAPPTTTTTSTKQRVTAKGRDVPHPIESFQELADKYGLSPLLLKNLQDSGYHYPTGVQAHGIPILLESRDLAAISPTGTGKTLSYLLPLISSLGSPGAQNSAAATGAGVRALVLAPTRELAHQIHNECLKLAQGRKWRVVLFSKASASTLADKSVRDRVDIVISTPLRLVAALQAGKIELGNVRHLVLDEADRMLDPEFLEQVQEVVAACTHPSLQKAVFSATLPANAEKTAMDMLRDPVRIVVGLKDTPLPLIAQSLTYVADDASKLPTLLAYLAQPYNPPVVIFTASQPRASSLAEELVLAGTPNVDCLHAGMTRQQRTDAVARVRKGEAWVIVCTEVMARGMDFKGVREVINYDFPTSVQSYVHRIGRTGRAGREGKAVTYFTNEDAPYLKAIANVLAQSGSTVPDWILKLPKPSKLKRRQMGKLKRAEYVTPDARVGRADAIKKRDMIAGSKRRAVKPPRTKEGEWGGINKDEE